MIDNSFGDWQYQIDGGSSWTSISNTQGLVDLNGNALLLGPSDSTQGLCPTPIGTAKLQPALPRLGSKQR